MNSCNKKIISLLTCFSLLVFNVLPVLGADTTIAGDSDNASQTGQTNVKARVPSTFTIGIPKTVIIDAATNTASYSVTCTGDISGNEYISVIPDTSILLNQFGKSSVTAEIMQSATKFRSNTYTKTLADEEVLMSTGITGSITITGAELSAGNWSGVLNFDITLGCSVPTVEATVTNDSGNPITSTVSVITGTEKENLVAGLLSSNVILSSDDVKALVEVETETFEGTATAIFDVSEFAVPGDTIFIYHYDSTTDTWELIGEEIVADDYTITGMFASFSPVAFTVEHVHSYTSSGVEATCTKPGSITKVCTCGDMVTESTEALGHNIVEGLCTRCEYAVPGFYTLDKTIFIPWNTLVEDYGLNVNPSTRYNETTYATTEGAPNVVFKTINPENLPFKLVVDDNVTAIGQYAFYSKSESDACYYMTKVVLPDTITSIEDGAFKNCTNLETIILSASLSKIGNYAFQNCIALKEIDLPESLTAINRYAFSKAGLTSITIPESVTSIPSTAFHSCSNLTSVTWKSSAAIGSGMFAFCTSLTDVNMQGTTKIEAGAFKSCTALQKIVIPDTVTIINDGTEGAFEGCTTLSSVTLSNSLTKIGSMAFCGCKSLKAINLPSSLITIGYGAFANTSLEEIVIPDTVTVIENGYPGAFSCNSLSKVTLSKNLTKIGARTFQACTSLEAIEIPPSVTTIGGGAFTGCTALHEIVIPDTVTTIESDAFKNVSHITYNGEATGSPWGALSIN